MIIKAEAKNKKFGEKLTHRDYLGALMHLGIEREIIEDIFVEGNEAYIIAKDHMTDYICDELCRVKHTDITCNIIDELPPGCGPKFKSISLISSSLRIDGIISKMYKLSRNDSKKAFARNEIAVNGVEIQNNSYFLKEGDIVSVRHHGKFAFKEIEKTTKKGNIVVLIDEYV